MYTRSLRDPERFWAEAAEEISWVRRWEKVLDTSGLPFARWFPGGILNTCHNALDRHVEEGRGDRVALVYDSPVTATIRRYTFKELQDLVARCAGGLRDLGVVKGDRVVIYMPMIPEAVISMLACARIGAIHSVVFGGFAPKELASRIRDARPKVVLIASCGIEVSRVIPYKPLIDEAIAIAGIPVAHCVIVQRPECPTNLADGRDREWKGFMDTASPAECVPVQATDPLYILYTSGTTGIPKGVVRDNGGHLAALLWSMRYLYGLSPGEVFWAASDVGWVVGHSYIVYGPLAYGSTSILYEGKSVGTPDPGAFWRVASQHGVNVLFCAPTALRAIKREDPGGKYLERHDLSRMRTLFLAGERCDPDTLAWAKARLSIPVIDHWWQTETGWAIGANPVGLTMLPVKPGSCTRAMPGFDVRVLDDRGIETPVGVTGNIVIRLPLPPGCFTTLWQKDDECVRTYFSAYPGFYLTGDAGFIDEDRYLWIMGRTDDIINTAGHRLSTGAMEEVLASHPDVAECAVTGVADEVKGEIPVGFVVLKSGVRRENGDVVQELIQMVRDRIGPIASFKAAVVVRRLPKTRSGKILRGVMKKIADGERYSIPPTIEDQAVLGEVAESLMSIGYPRRAR
ncbi:MAG: Acetyl-coenzyme A synthetase [Methanoregulaceae archaeon PtaB.Bin009]|nr:MAG: Acetyl-coenzyme A synthetase [Methanoregulaceae archaeon PtaB.Bin009]OPY38795.1 MAG: Acetyl-coenzyme A synthetase [Methanoregulaceae archaeon PtaU1.Bin066]HNQ28794.1 propionyl-CoA synthetase [Methanolinea sp.]